MTKDEIFMQRCLELASNGLGKVSPNPMVGAVIVHEEKIIGEGYHHSLGEAHGEVNAIQNALKSNPDAVLENSTLYVNLEPCTHYGKTPPCVNLIIEKKIPHVLIASKDPNEKVNGKGVLALEKAGIRVTTGVLEMEARKLNRRFFTFHEKKRPFVILKYAQSMDGFIATKNPDVENRWISNPWSRKLVHKWRSEESSILVGSRTALLDNPHLTVRNWTGKNPLRIVINRDLSLPKHLHLFDGSTETIVINDIKSGHEDKLEYVKLNFSQPVLPQLMTLLHTREVSSILVEGGQNLLNKFIESNLWDEARVFTGNIWLKEGLRAPVLPGKIYSEERIRDDLLTLTYPI